MYSVPLVNISATLTRSQLSESLDPLAAAAVHQAASDATYAAGKIPLAPSPTSGRVKTLIILPA
jgi:hypothetical protein